MTTPQTFSWQANEASWVVPPQVAASWFSLLVFWVLFCISRFWVLVPVLFMLFLSLYAQSPLHQVHGSMPVVFLFYFDGPGLMSMYSVLRLPSLTCLISVSFWPSFPCLLLVYIVLFPLFSVRLYPHTHLCVLFTVFPVWFCFDSCQQ